MDPFYNSKVGTMAYSDNTVNVSVEWGHVGYLVDAPDKWAPGEPCDLAPGDVVRITSNVQHSDGSTVQRVAVGELRRWADGWLGFTGYRLAVNKEGRIALPGSGDVVVELVERRRPKVGDELALLQDFTKAPRGTVAVSKHGAGDGEPYVKGAGGFWRDPSGYVASTPRMVQLGPMRVVYVPGGAK